MDFPIPANLLGWLVPAALLLMFILPNSVRILREYERGVVFRLGKLLGAKGPGLVFLIPLVDKMVRMDLRVVTINVAKQEVMTRDNVPVTVDAVIYFMIMEPEAAVVKVENYLAGHLAHCPNHPAQRARAKRTGRIAGQARQDQRHPPGNH